MKLSILVTFYNSQEYVDDALQSIFLQIVDFEFEVLIGDDGSTDETVAKIIEWEKRYPNNIKHFIMKRDTTKNYNSIFRASKNRINLLKHATGEYLAFLDGDDYYINNNKLQMQIDILDNPKNHDCVMCAHNVNYFYQWNKHTKPINQKMPNQKVQPKEYWMNMYFCSIGLVARNVFKGVFPMDFNQRYFDDNLITFYLLKFGAIYYLPDIMANYRQTRNSSWNSKNHIEQNILNLIDYNIEIQMEPKMKKVSLLRHFSNMQYLFYNRTIINKNDYIKYYKQAKKDGAKEALRWICYNDNNTILKYFSIVKFLLYNLCFYLYSYYYKTKSIVRNNKK